MRCVHAWSQQSSWFLQLALWTSRTLGTVRQACKPSARAHAPHHAELVPRGLEPRTLRLLAVRSDQLSYETCWLASEFERLYLWAVCMLGHSRAHGSSRMLGAVRQACRPSAHTHAQQYVEVVPRGLEPRTLRLLAVRSDQLGHETSEYSGDQQWISM